MSATAEVYILFLFFIIIMFLLYGFFQKRIKIQEDMLSNHNFSGISVLVQERLRQNRNYSCGECDLIQIMYVSDYEDYSNKITLKFTVM
ncbi:hypothetical protein GWI33_009679 [Rhynchophorus ferrugineus]|uniref:Uncharacterized protein n=1 Tax=Rhynchophorus ferrugineus TaxID=354439 RepID=A0A834IF74_RHYFE|nr:hypothetical protein GWI33_009679 [Rhynchophorus ferrugineus]